jgi:hypothetical protein
MRHILKRGPAERELRDALEIMLAWATGPDKHNNPYCYSAIKNAMRVLGRAKGLACDYLDVPIVDLPIPDKKIYEVNKQ